MSKPQKSSRAQPEPENYPTGTQKPQNDPKKQNIKNSEKQKNLTKRKLSVYKSKAPKTFPTPSQPQT